MPHLSTLYLWAKDSCIYSESREFYLLQMSGCSWNISHFFCLRSDNDSAGGLDCFVPFRSFCRRIEDRSPLALLPSFSIYNPHVSCAWGTLTLYLCLPISYVQAFPTKLPTLPSSMLLSGASPSSFLSPSASSPVFSPTFPSPISISWSSSSSDSSTSLPTFYQFLPPSNNSLPSNISPPSQLQYLQSNSLNQPP